MATAAGGLRWRGGPNLPLPSRRGNRPPSFADLLRGSRVFLFAMGSFLGGAEQRAAALQAASQQQQVQLQYLAMAALLQEAAPSAQQGWHAPPGPLGAPPSQLGAAAPPAPPGLGSSRGGPAAARLAAPAATCPSCFCSCRRGSGRVRSRTAQSSATGTACNSALRGPPHSQRAVACSASLVECAGRLLPDPCCDDSCKSKRHSSVTIDGPVGSLIIIKNLNYSQRIVFV